MLRSLAGCSHTSGHWFDEDFTVTFAVPVIAAIFNTLVLYVVQIVLDSGVAVWTMG